MQATEGHFSMYKSFDIIFHNASRLVQPDRLALVRQTASFNPETLSGSRLAKSASRATIPIVQGSPLVRSSLPNLSNNPVVNPVGLLNMARLGGARAYSDDLPPTSLITRYKPVLEDAIAHHDEMVELIEHGNYSIASFIKISLNVIPGVSSIRLDNGYSILAIEEAKRVKNTTARIYDLLVMPPDRLEGVTKPFVLSVTVYKADALKHARPSNLKLLFGLCENAVNIHKGKLPRTLYSSINVFSPTFQELGKLYSCAKTVKDLISTGYVSTPAGLFEAINNQMKARVIDPQSKFISSLKSILIEAFNHQYSGYEQEVQRLLEKEKTPQSALFQHSISHRGGAFLAAMQLNALAKGNPNAGLSATCVTHSAEFGEQRFTIVYHPSGVWIEKKNNPQTGQLEGVVFATPPQLSETLKQRGVQVIISQSLGML
jgi:hypothetical protein